MRLQRTLKKELTIEGIGLHTGVHSIVRLIPAPSNSGIVFYREDRNVFIRADINAVNDTAFATTLGSGGTRVKTVEHLLAALSGLGIDNLVVGVNGPEIPVMDGSSAVFVDLMLKAGIAKQTSERPFIRILKPISFKEGNAEIYALPFEGTLITYQIQYKHPLLGTQKKSLKLDEKTFVRELAPARTFGFLKDVELMRANGLAKGGSLENAIILTDTAVLNESGLRFQDEFIRHKMLDLIGDLSFIGFPLLGHIVAVRTGHGTNCKFAKTLLSAPECWEVTLEARPEEAVHAHEREMLKLEAIPSFLTS